MSPGRLLQSPPPDVAVEIDHSHVAAARLGWRGGEAVIAAHATEVLAPGLVVPGLLGPNISDVPAVSQAVARALAQLGGSRPSRVSLVVPDTVAKVSLLRLETIPPKAADLQEIVRWQMRKTSPFPMEQAVVSVSPGARGAEGHSELVVTVARTDVIHQYEQACLMAGAQAGLVDLASFTVLNGVLGSASVPKGDWLLVHVTSTYLTLAVVRGDELLFFRNRDGSEGISDLIHQTAMYYEDRLHGFGFERVLIAGGARLPGGAEHIRRGLVERLRVNVEAVTLQGVALPDRINASQELVDLLSPLVGALIRERRAA